MGYLSALDMAAHVPLRQALEWHLTSNHFPPLPASFVPVAVRVIRYARRGEYDRLVRLPEGARYRDGAFAPVRACIRAWHLAAFIDGGEP